MKFYACLFALAAIVCFVSADKTDKKEGLVAASYGAPAPPSYAAPAPQSYAAPAPQSYAAPSYAPPPCPKNYLFSCQPNLAAVPCASGGYAGAYSEHVPQYALPQYALPKYHGMPQY